MIPNSYVSALIEGLKNNLESAFNEVDITMNWDNYTSIEPSVNNYSGRIFVETKPKTTDDLSGYVSLQKKMIPSVYDITLESFVAHNNASQAYLLGQDLLEFLANHVLFSIRPNGITGNFRGVELNDALIGLNLTNPLKIGYEDRQGGFSLVQVRVNFNWKKED